MPRYASNAVALQVGASVVHFNSVESIRRDSESAAERGVLAHKGTR